MQMMLLTMLMFNVIVDTVNSSTCKKYGCIQYEPENHCQCNFWCERYNNCCNDYKTECTTPIEQMSFINDLGKYPNRKDNFFEGEVILTWLEDVLLIQYIIKAEINQCAQSNGKNNACGIHIHKGTSCDHDDLVGGHYYKGVKDIWEPIVYTTLPGKKYATGAVLVPYKYNKSETIGHAFVVHDSQGERVTCAIIGQCVSDDNCPSDLGYCSSEGYCIQYDYDYCTLKNKCGLGDGDCDGDATCEKGLECKTGSSFREMHPHPKFKHKTGQACVLPGMDSKQNPSNEIEKQSDGGSKSNVTSDSDTDNDLDTSDLSGGNNLAESGCLLVATMFNILMVMY